MISRPTIRIPVTARPVEEKRNLSESIDWLASQAFNRYQEGATKRDGNLCDHVSNTYFRAVQLGFKGHMRIWRDKVLAAGNMTMADFPDMPGQGKLE